MVAILMKLTYNVFMTRWQRDPDQIQRDRSLIATWTAQHYKSEEIVVLLESETGYKLSPRTIRKDQMEIRAAWRETQRDQYQALVNQELVRLDALEQEAWEAWRGSKTGSRETKVVEEMARAMMESVVKDESTEMFISKIRNTTQNKEPKVQFLTAIHEIQKERRKLLGLYAPAEVGINVNKRSELLIKAYRTVSPDDWDSEEKHIAAAAMSAINDELAIEAEIIDA